MFFFYQILWDRLIRRYTSKHQVTAACKVHPGPVCLPGMFVKVSFLTVFFKNTSFSHQSDNPLTGHMTAEGGGTVGPPTASGAACMRAAYACQLFLV